MGTKLTTINNLDIAVLEPRGSLIGGEETDELKAKAKDLIEQGNKKLVLDLGGITYINSPFGGFIYLNQIQIPILTINNVTYNLVLIADLLAFLRS